MFPIFPVKLQGVFSTTRFERFSRCVDINLYFCVVAPLCLYAYHFSYFWRQIMFIAFHLRQINVLIFHTVKTDTD